MASLDLSLNQITDITPLADLPLLSILNLSYNQVDDITMLVNLTGLLLFDNQVSDITL